MQLIDKIYKNIETCLIYLFIFSIFLIQKITYNSISLYEILFIIFLLFSFKKLLKNLSLSFFLEKEVILLCVLAAIISYKYFIYNDYIYQVSVVTFLIISYLVFLLLITLDKDKQEIYLTLKNCFKLIFLICGLIIILFYFLKKIGFIYEEVWLIREDVYPYLNYVPIHFKGLYSSYNYQAYIMIPGFFFYLEEIFLKKNKLYLIIFLIISFFIFFTVKAKVLFLIIAISFFYLLNKYTKLNKINFYSFLIITTFGYLFITHFIPLKTQVIGFEYDLYFTKSPLFNLGDYNIYGSLFYKIKLLIIQNLEILNLLPPNKDFELETGQEPHSVYLLFVYNYGIIALSCFLLFVFFIILKFNSLYFKKKNNIILIDFLIFILFLIEGINQDINSYRFFWITTSMLSGILYLNQKN